MNREAKPEPTTETRTLSSRQTFLWKWLFAPIWIIGFGIGTLRMWQENPSVPASFDWPLAPRWLFVVGWVVGSVMLYLMIASLKRVRVDGTRLWISNYLSEIVVPLSDVTAVSQIRWFSPPQAVVHLRRDGGFGEKIRFMLRTRLYLPWRPHPDVKWLREAAQRAGGLK